MFDHAPKSSEYILPRVNGCHCFTARNDRHLSKSWHGHREAVGFDPGGFDKLSDQDKTKQLHFHDLRKTAVTMLVVAGATVAQIASITGHTMQSVKRILDRYMASTPVLSKAAVTAIESAPDAEFANQ